MKKNKYLLLISSLGSLLLFAGAALDENFLQEWRRIQRTGQSEEGPIPVQLRQIVNPSLGIADRCVSCHVSMGPGEQGVRGAAVLKNHKPVVHDPAEFGCTVCHGGQGQATVQADAHGEVHFWPEPMLAKDFTYAGCGRCHATLRVPEQQQMKQAVAAFERLDCLACHRVDGRGGTIRPDGGGMEGPDLSRSGTAGYDSAWHEKHVAKSKAAPSAAWSAFRLVSDADLPLLRIYMDTRVAAPKLVGAKSVFLSHGCLGCHKVSGVGGDDGPDLTRSGEKDPGQVDFKHVPGQPTMQNWMAEHFRAPASVVVGSQMPPVSLSSKEISDLTLFALSLRRGELRDVYLPKDRVRVVRFGEREFASDGATIYGAFCAGCHGEDGGGRRLPGLVSFPSIANPDFLALASDEFLRKTVEQGRPGRRMPGWLKAGGLTPVEIQNVIGYVRGLGGVQAAAEGRPPRWAAGDVGAGQRVFASGCSGCHGQDGKGGEGPALNNQVLLDTATDSYLAETIRRGRRGTAMSSFTEPSPVRRALSEADIEAVVSYLRSLQGGRK